jgi:dTDP-4-dehydrorhamnose 3,5-epimerase
LEPLDIEGAWVVRPRVFSDDRGDFLEWFRGADFGGATGHDLSLAQANCSVSRRGSLRGIHFADVPPGQAKYVTCVRGAVLDVVVDIRVGSPTYGQSQLVPLDDSGHHAVYVSEGLGHGFLALTDDATVIYLCSAPYNPTGEHGINPLDPALAIPWPSDVAPLLSEKDAAAPSLAEAKEQGLLPLYDACVSYRAALPKR